MEITEDLADTSRESVFITGASGCVGHYLIKQCLLHTDWQIHVLVRVPERLKFSEEEKKRVTVHQGDFRKIEAFEPVIKKMNYIIHSVTEWWGTEQTIEVNVNKTKTFFLMTDPAVCKRIMYFSTASILGKGGVVVKEAEMYGSDYIKSKYKAYHMIQSLPMASSITVLFPTLVFGGDQLYPQSHITSGVMGAVKYLKYLKYITVDGGFHFLHADDIAKVAVQSLLKDSEYKEYVLGNNALSIKKALWVLCESLHKTPLFRVHVSFKFILFLASVFRIKIGPWERYCIENPNMIFDTVSPDDFGEETSFPTLESVLEDIKAF